MIQQLVDILLDGMEHAIGFLKAVELSPGINLWTITMSAFIMAVVIKGLINVVGIGGMRSGRSVGKSRKADSRANNEEAK